MCHCQLTHIIPSGGVKAVLKRWRNCGVYGELAAGVAVQWGPGAKPPEAGGILISDSKNNIETGKINSNKSQLEKNTCWS